MRKNIPLGAQVKKPDRGFSLLEVIVSVALFAIILSAVILFFSSMNLSSEKTTAARDALENAKKVLDQMTFEIRSAKGIYTPTTTATQLSLETSRYLPSGETDAFIDFFLCGNAVCLKKEGQDDAIALTSASVSVTNLAFSQISTGSAPSVQISLTVSSGSGQSASSISLVSTASVRSY